MARNLRARIFTILIYAAFFASGASCLIAEVTWNRMLIVVVGNSLSATALILIIFMGGLGLGSYIGGRFFGKRRITLLPYVLLEITIGIFVLVSPTLFELLSGLFTSLSETVNNGTGLTIVRITVTMGALLLPAILMGATFPAIISGAALDAPERRTARTGYLYSINTLGAALGCFVAGVHLLFEFGVQFTLNCAFAFYIFAALCGLIANRLAEKRSSEAREVPASDGTKAPGASPLRRFLYIATFGIGFVALGYEVLLTRLGILYLGNTVSVFALVLTGFLLGTGISAILGTWFYGVLRRSTKRFNDLFGYISLAAGAFVLITPYLLLLDWVVSSEHFARFADAGPRSPLLVLGIIIAPTILIGALLPIAIRMLQPTGRGAATRDAATLYALNTAGGVVGAGVANHFLVPLIGIQATVILLTSLCAAIGVINLLSPGNNPRRWTIAGFSVGALTALLFLVLPNMMDLYAAKLAASTRAPETEVHLIHEGRAATITVLDQRDPEKGIYRDMYLNGVEEASTRFWHTQLFKLLGLFPVLTHESEKSKDVLVIAFGAGITAGSVLASDQVSSLDVVDLNPDIEEINDLFTDVNGDVFHKPRFNFHTDDGRSYLVTNNKQYDVIINDSTHPRAYDSWILYTDEFYRAVQKRLLPGGVFAQWVPVHGSMQGDLFRIHLNTFRRVFPNSTFWYVYGSDQAFLMATPDPYALDVNRLEQQLARLPEWFRAQEYQIDTVTRLTGFFWLDKNTMNNLIGQETRINTDNIHYFEKQSAVRPSAPQWRLPFYQASILPYIKGGDAGLRTAVRGEQSMALLMGKFGFFRTKPDLFNAFCLMPDNKNVQYWMFREFSGQIPDPSTFCQDREIMRYRAILAQHPDNFLAMNAIADLLSARGELGEALPLAERAISLAPQNGMILDTYGWILFQQNKYKEALDALKKSDTYLPNHHIILYHLGATYLALGEKEHAKAHLEKSLGISSDFSGIDEARRLLQSIQ